jgi:hypothetical protein
MEDYSKFIKHVDAYLRQKGLNYTIDGDSVLVTDASWKFGQMGLANLAQICNRSRPSEWKSIVYGHFDKMRQTSDFDEAFYKRAHDYSYAAPYIGVRIYHNDYVSHIGDEAVIHRQIAEDLMAILVFDFDHGVSNLKPETAIQWNRTNEALFETGLANIRQKYAGETALEKIEDTGIWIIQGDHFFVANSVLDSLLQSIPSGAFGSLVGIPHRHAVLAYPINDLGVINSLPQFAYIVRGMYGEGPGSISESLYWYRDGELMRLPYTIEDESFTFTPPQEFLDVMNELPAAE